MGRFFDMDGGVFRFLSKLADIMILNLVFLVTCIPIVTIGAAWTSLYYVALKMIRNEESYIVRGYFKSFKENFKQATIIWLIVFAVMALMFVDFRILSVMEGTAANVMRVGLTMVGVIFAMVVLYLFPVLSKFYNSIKNTFINSLLMSLRHLPLTVVMMAISIGSVIVTFINGYTITYGILVWILLGFALVAMANSWFFVKIFDNYIPKEDTEEASAEAMEEAKETE